jgi:hypothetical protein
MTAPMSWSRTWRIIRYVKEHRYLTPGQRAYLNSEVLRMDYSQAARFRQECPNIMSQEVSVACRN